MVNGGAIPHVKYVKTVTKKMMSRGKCIGECDDGGIYFQES